MKFSYKRRALLRSSGISATTCASSRDAAPGPCKRLNASKPGGPPKLPLNLLDALRSFDKDTDLKSALGEEFAQAYLKLKGDEWNAYASHFTQWELEHTLDV